MKISMYTFLFEIDSKFYAYNTLSNALIEIAEDTYKILLVNKNRHTPFLTYPPYLSSPLTTLLLTTTIFKYIIIKLHKLYQIY